MQFNLDKRFVQILNDQGHQLTWEQLRAAYEVRKAEREADPAAIATVTAAVRRDQSLDRPIARLPPPSANPPPSPPGIWSYRMSTLPDL